MSDDTIEVPVTRRARVTLIGRITYRGLAEGLVGIDNLGEERLHPGDMFALRSQPGAPWKPGIGRLHGDDSLELCRIPTRADGDYLYRVEPPETP